jgi:hypothetical protein
MAKSRFDALGLAPGAPVTLRPLEYGLFAAPDADPAPVTAVPAPDSPHHMAA